MHSCPLSHKYEQLLLRPHFQNPQFSRSKTCLNQMCSNWLLKKSLIQVLRPFKLSMLKSSPIFKRNGAHLVKKRTLVKIKIIHF